MYKSLQSGRALAAVAVFLMHLFATVFSPKNFDRPNLMLSFWLGQVGVYFFFVLSGFIIFTVHRGDLFQKSLFNSYLVKRFIRIYPTYFIIYGGVLLFAFFSPSTRLMVSENVELLLRWFLFIPEEGQNGAPVNNPIIVVAWSLQFEMVFYILFGFFILGRIPALIVILALMGLFGLKVNGIALPFPLDHFIGYDSVLFAAGAFVGFVHSLKRGSLQFFVYLFSGLLVFFLILHYLKVDAVRVAYGGGIVVLIYLMVSAEEMGFVLGWQDWVQRIGDASYALYLIHYPLVSVATNILYNLFGRRFGILGAIPILLIAGGLSLFVALQFHSRVEKPMIQWLRRRLL